MIQIRYLSRADVLAAGGADFRLAVEDVREATRLLRSGKASMVAESVLPVSGDARENAYGLPASLGGDIDAAGLKWAMHRAAPVGDLPSITSATFVNRLSDGRPLGLVESALLTRMRTAAVTAIAMDMLPKGTIRRVAVLGAGAQARAHVEMIRALFPEVTEIRLWNRTTERRDVLLTELSDGNGPALLAAETIKGAIEPADVVLCCTTSPEPLLGPDVVRPGRLVVQIGYNEVSFEAIVGFDHVVVDLWGDFAERSAKSLFQMYRAKRFEPGRVSADLSQLVVDRWRPPEKSSIYFSSFGLNLFDIALAARVLRQAEMEGIGALLPFV
ncbi:ornithine cyclodeaminase family protein [Jiella pacifica]|uniref:Ornithine cyclodeaminase n=1 Tax=Jiella pacifica TaxID=2696469 RepID=A0A6N9SVQ4_9HYPH|nr:ornithine cyclodeaminase family protein [Jiella pacifica]NDW02881.1 ornithine cyclodeaminase [Jiella pacifica]